MLGCCWELVKRHIVSEWMKGENEGEERGERKRDGEGGERQ